MLRKISPFLLTVLLFPGASLLSPVPASAGEPAPCESLPSAVYLGGAKDDLELPTDPSSRGPELEIIIPPIGWKDFDDTAVNRSLGHTFDGLPAEIVRAELQVRAEPTAGSANDTLSLRIDTGPSAYASAFADLPGGGDWTTSTVPAPVIFTFDLAALPGGGSILDQVATARRLDVYIQDDTTVDYMELRVWYHPWETFRFGLMDDFAPPSEPGTRSPELNALSGLWKGTDDSTANFWVGHTFAGLPGNLTEGHFEIRMRPHSDIPSNDALHLRLDPAGNLDFGTRIDALPESGGTWNPGDPAAIFHLDLDDLPGGGSLLADLSAEGKLDFLVQDDTDVDYAKLRLRACPPRRRVGGLAHGPLGDALLSQLGRRSVTMTGLDGEGDDGVRIELGEAKGWGFTLVDPFDTPGSTRSWTMRGKVDGLLDRPIFTERVEVSAGEGSNRVDVFHDHSATGATQVQASFFGEDGALLHQATLDNGLVYSFDYTFEPPPPYVVRWDATCVVLPPIPFASITVGDGTTIVDVAKIELEALDSTQTVEFCSAVESTGTNLVEATLAEEVQILWECPHWNQGGAGLAPFAGALHVTDLGVDGRDGVSFELGGADGVQLELLPLDLAGEAPVGSFLQLDATGEVGGQGDQGLGRMLVTKEATDRYAFDVDFSDLATEQVRVQIFRSDFGLVYEEVVGVETNVLADLWPDRLGKLGGQTECFAAGFPEEVIFTFPGTARGEEGVAGDELRLLAEGGVEVGPKATFTLRAAGLEEFAIGHTELDPEDLQQIPFFADDFESGDMDRWSTVVP